jgi:hypothetical protein
VQQVRIHLRGKYRVSQFHLAYLIAFQIHNVYDGHRQRPSLKTFLSLLLGLF